MNVKRKNRLLLSSILLGIIGVIILIPFLYMVVTSLKSKPEIMSREGSFFPKKINWLNYKKVFASASYFTSLWNSFFTSSVTTILSVFLSAMVGYGIAKFKNRLLKDVLFLFMISMMIPPFMVALPLYLVAAPLGLTNNLWAIIIPFAVSNFGIFLMHQYCLSIPDDLLAAGRIDGASEFRIFWNIALPTVSAGCSAFGILKFLMTWNDFFFPLIMLTKEKKMTLQVLLATSIDFEYGVDYGYIMALSTMVVVPVIIIFIIFQQQILEGVATSGIKG
ncbi:MAG: carbohydrate ABC transporter permease [Sphaerochaetaceae bacterium]